MSYTLVTDDGFARADTSVGSGANSTTGVGNGWIDFVGNLYNIVSQVLSDGRVNSPGGNPPNNSLYRQGTENFQNGKVLSYSNTSLITGTSGAACTLRFNPASGGSGYSGLFYVDAGGYFFIYKLVNGSQSTLYSGVIGTSIPTNYVVEFVAQSTDVNTTQLTINLYDQSNLSSAVATHSITDTTAALQTSGAAAVSSYNGGYWTRVQTYQVSTALSAGTLSATATYKTANSLSATAATGGSGSLSYQWYRSTTNGFTPGPDNIVSGATSLTLADSGLTPGTTYYYAVIVTDSTTPTPQTATYPQLTVTQLGYNAIILGVIGDSISATPGYGGVNPSAPVVEVSLLNAANIPAALVDQAVAGTSTTDWQPGGSYLPGALAAFAAAGVNVVQIMLGTNDSKTGGASSGTWLSNMQAIANAAIANGASKVIVNQVIYLPDTSSPFDSGSNGRIQGFNSEIGSLTGITVGDQTAYVYMQTNAGTLYQGDNTHPNVAGAAWLGGAWARGLKAGVLGRSSGASMAVGLVLGLGF